MKPKVVFSRCFSEPVRYNGEVIRDDFVDRLKKFVEPLYVCPETEIGLGVPRKMLVLMEEEGEKRLVQLETKIDLTEKMRVYGNEKLKDFEKVDGFILKAKSPSCGVNTSKFYRKGVIAGRTYGLFANLVKERLSHIPLGDEAKLRDKSEREHFLTKVFAFSELRGLMNDPRPDELVKFHTRYKYLLMTYSQKSLKELGQLVATNMPFHEKVKKYKVGFYRAFLRKPSIKRHTNTLMHLMGHISKKISPKERTHFLSLIGRYREGRVGLKTIKELIKSLAYRFDNEYILLQKYLEPYPEELDL